MPLCSSLAKSSIKRPRLFWQGNIALAGFVFFTLNNSCLDLIEVHNWPIYNSTSSFFYYRFVNKETEIPGKGDRQFIRKGVVGDWKNHFSPESSAEWDQWIAKEFQGTGIQAAFDNE